MNRYFFVCLFLICFFVSHQTRAESKAFHYYLGGSVNYMETKYTVAGFKYDPNFTTLNTELIASMGPVYLRINYDQSIKEEVAFEPSGAVVFFSREEYGYTLGYEVYQGITLLLGYLAAKSGFPSPGQIPASQTMSTSGLNPGPMQGSIIHCG